MNSTPTCTDHSIGTLVCVTVFPNRTMLHIGYHGNDIFVFLRVHYQERLSPPKILDITDDPPLTNAFHGTLIQNGVRHNHIVGAFDERTGHLIIRHQKRIYLVKLPPSVKEIHCGGNRYCF